MSAITLIDTSVLCELLEVPGKSDPRRGPTLHAEMDRRVEAGERLVIPVSAVIETGNHIAQCAGDRHAVARRLARLLRASGGAGSPWRVADTRFDQVFVDALCDGDSTGRDLAALAAAHVGAGDVAILVERDQLRARSAITQVRVWTLDETLRGMAGSIP